MLVPDTRPFIANEKKERLAAKVVCWILLANSAIYFVRAFFSNSETVYMCICILSTEQCLYKNMFLVVFYYYLRIFMLVVTVLIFVHAPLKKIIEPDMDVCNF